MVSHVCFSDFLLVDDLRYWDFITLTPLMIAIILRRDLLEQHLLLLLYLHQHLIKGLEPIFEVSIWNS